MRKKIPAEKKNQIINNLKDNLVQQNTQKNDTNKNTCKTNRQKNKHYNCQDGVPVKYELERLNETIPCKNNKSMEIFYIERAEAQGTASWI